jgi:hypothetical protein
MGRNLLVQCQIAVSFEPRVGFNLDVTGDAKTVVRGGSEYFQEDHHLCFYLMQSVITEFLLVLLMK